MIFLFRKSNGTLLPKYVDAQMRDEVRQSAQDYGTCLEPAGQFHRISLSSWLRKHNFKERLSDLPLPVILKI